MGRRPRAGPRENVKFTHVQARANQVMTEHLKLRTRTRDESADAGAQNWQCKCAMQRQLTACGHAASLRFASLHGGRGAVKSLAWSWMASGAARRDETRHGETARALQSRTRRMLSCFWRPMGVVIIAENSIPVRALELSCNLTCRIYTPTTTSTTPLRRPTAP